MVGVLLPKGLSAGQLQQPVLGGSPMLGGQPSLDFLTRIPAAIQQATGWQPGTTPQWMPDWLRNLSGANTAQTQATQQNLAALPSRYAMTPQDINTAMSLGMSGGTLAPEDLEGMLKPGEQLVYHGSRTGELGSIGEQAPNFNFFGREGIYTTNEPAHAEMYAKGFEAKPGETDLGHGSVTALAISPQKVFEANAPLGQNAQPLMDAMRNAAGKSARWLEPYFEQVTPDTTLEQLAANGVGTAAYIPRALKALGYDAIRQRSFANESNVMVLLDPARGRILAPNINK